jgi:hypothetical protein
LASLVGLAALTAPPGPVHAQSNDAPGRDGAPATPRPGTSKSGAGPMDGAVIDKTKPGTASDREADPCESLPNDRKIECRNARLKPAPGAAPGPADATSPSSPGQRDGTTPPRPSPKSNPRG